MLWISKYPPLYVWKNDIMIIFDLDGTLADCEHRRHFVDPRKCNDYVLQGYDGNGKLIEESMIYCNIIDGKPFKPNWKAFHEACEKDKPVYPVIGTFKMMQFCSAPIKIWSGRCESVKEKTIDWLKQHLTSDINWIKNLKMRPEGDYTPDEVLKERWLDEAIAQGQTIDFVFDDRPKVVKMWRSRGIFVFDCNQTGKEF